MRGFMKKKITIIVPVYNEQEVLNELLIRLKKVINQETEYNFELVMVENGSVDRSFDILLFERKSDPRVKIVRLSKNFGCDGAITAGLSYVQSDAAIIMNADLQDPPELIPAFLRKWEDGFDIVYGKISKRYGENILRKICSSIFYVLINALTKGLFPRNASDFRLISNNVIKTVNNMKETNRFMRGMIAWTGFSQVGVEFQRPSRYAGESKSGFLLIFKIAMNAFFAFSYF